jgi:hypothetical protein
MDAPAGCLTGAIVRARRASLISQLQNSAIFRLPEAPKRDNVIAIETCFPAIREPAAENSFYKPPNPAKTYFLFEFRPPCG